MSTLSIGLIIELRMVSMLYEHIDQSHHNNILLMLRINPSPLHTQVAIIMFMFMWSAQSIFFELFAFTLANYVKIGMI